MTPSQFIQTLYPIIAPSLSGCTVAIWNKQDSTTIHALPTDPNLDQIVQSEVAKNRDVYYGVSLRAPGLQPKQQGKVTDCRALPGLWLDIDINTGHGSQVHAANNLPTTLDHCVEILEALPEPTLLIDSGHGLHAYWLLDQPHEFTYADTLSLSKQSDSFQSKAIEHARTLGYHVDNTSTLNRVLRLPGTVNTKAGLNKPVLPLITDGPRYKDLPTLLASASISTPFTASAPIVSQPTQTDLEPRDAGIKAQTDQYVTDCLNNLADPQSKALASLVLQGLPFAPAGQRDQTLQRIASIIAYIAPDRPAHELAALLNDSLEKFEPEDQGQFDQQDRLIWASEKIERAQLDARRDRAAKEKHNESLLKTLLAQARSVSRRDQRLGPSPEGPYTDPEIKAFSSQQATTPANFSKRWIIQKGSAFYVYVNGDYQKALNEKELDVSLPRDLAPAAANDYIDLETPNSKGELRKKTTKEILLDYASVARTVIGKLDAGHSFYDEQTQTFFEATCPIRPLTPQFDSNIDKWLRLLGPLKHNALLDWVATITHLSKQTCALYLEGPKNTGKSMLTQGLAKLWHQGGPTELACILGDWTDDITRCPLIAADEQIRQGFKGQRSSAELRSLIGTNNRTLKRKFRDNADLKGAIRLILAANNSDLLVFEETLSQNDLDAVAGRFLHILGDDQAARFLETIDTTGWVEDDLIAKHALWLRDNRTVIPGKRFLVEGSAKDVSKHIATRGGVAGRVCEWLVRYLCDTPLARLQAHSSPPQQKDVVRVGNGQYLVNTDAIITFWEQYAKSKMVPSTPQVGQALRNLSIGQARLAGKRFFKVDLEAITNWAESNLIGTKEMIEERLAHPFKHEDDEDIQSDS